MWIFILWFCIYFDIGAWNSVWCSPNVFALVHGYGLGLGGSKVGAYVFALFGDPCSVKVHDDDDHDDDDHDHDDDDHDDNHDHDHDDDDEDDDDDDDDFDGGDDDDADVVDGNDGDDDDFDDDFDDDDDDKRWCWTCILATVLWKEPFAGTFGKM